VQVAGHAQRPVAQPEALVEAEVGPRDLQAHVQVAAGAGVAADE